MKLGVQTVWDAWLTADPITILYSHVNETTDPFLMPGHRPIQWVAFQENVKSFAGTPCPRPQADTAPPKT